MLSVGVKPTAVTFSILVKLYGKARMLDKAFQMIDDMEMKFHLRPSVLVYTSLIQACIRNRQVKRALEVFDTMNRKGERGDGFAFGTLINGCACALHFDAAIDIMQQAANQGIKVLAEVANNLLGAVLRKGQEGKYGPTLLSLMHQMHIPVQPKLREQCGPNTMPPRHTNTPPAAHGSNIHNTTATPPPTAPPTATRSNSCDNTSTVQLGYEAGALGGDLPTLPVHTAHGEMPVPSHDSYSCRPLSIPVPGVYATSRQRSPSVSPPRPLRLHSLSPDAAVLSAGDSTPFAKLQGGSGGEDGEGLAGLCDDDATPSMCRLRDLANLAHTHTGSPDGYQEKPAATLIFDETSSDATQQHQHEQQP
ncbi:unnamed protein product [Vitrella brassicaformis CCMP3155]|uniref:Pentacotripeptide-repeat region of PRORP domain-containing protein n=1 Tax=Vitrella brassicaformis (strain CCMP3155) TaxID=1169540 RepID=A0A0G4EVF6_VITBC|nr:unnamed protein product [Vitrella brassicaformis CCMP3155]|eukprot:CEM02055.1 unnamed protein product [Vitrella brassicaformis CCMP3155]